VTIDPDSAQFSRALRAAIFWPVSVIFLTALLLLLFAIQLFQVIRWYDHSYEVLGQTKKCENELVAMQNQARGYFLTGLPVFIDSIDKDRKTIDTDFANLKQIVKDNPPQQIRADDLIQAKDTWVLFSLNNIAMRSHGTVPGADSLVLGKTIMDGILAKFDKFSSVEEKLRQDRLDRLRLAGTLQPLRHAGAFRRARQFPLNEVG